ncbi:MAG: TatD family hydrolase [Acidobacteria bacterium]|nr:TatD family hydrolase [Acidobacteriota bacterium]
MSLVDSHCHLADEAFAADLSEVAARAREAGLGGALCILSADDPDELTRAATVREVWPAVWFATAIHPHRAGAGAADAARAAEVVTAALERTGAIAVGEVGLDYHYDFSPRGVQRDVFAAQVAVAASRDLPVVVHTREAADDTHAVLQSAPGVRGVLHCFTGTRDEARRALDLGFYLSFSGIVTFPRAADLRDVAAFVPIDRLLVETDAPYLAPVPRRGQRNEPAWVTETVRALAATRRMSEPDLVSVLASNFAVLFRVTLPRVDTPAKPMV